MNRDQYGNRFKLDTKAEVRNPIGFAPVAPIHLLEEMWTLDSGLCGHYHLWLAHDILHEDGRHARFNNLAHGIYSRFGGATIFMDNSIVELGNSVDMRTVVHAAKLAGANVAVLPDVMGDGKATLEIFRESTSQLKKIPGWDSLEYMAVPQGPGLDMFRRCMEEYAQHPYVRWIGIPRIAVSQLGSRREVLRTARYAAKGLKLHLLGFSDSVADDLYCAALGEAQGIDSAVPVRAGQDGIKFSIVRNDYGKRGDYWERRQPLTSLAVANIREVRSLINARTRTLEQAL